MTQEQALNPNVKQLLALCQMDRTFVRGEGVHLFDASGRRFLDCYAQYGAVALGHHAPSVVAAVRAALDASEPAMVQPYRAPWAELQTLAVGPVFCWKKRDILWPMAVIPMVSKSVSFALYAKTMSLRQ